MITLLIAALATIAVLFAPLFGRFRYRRIEGVTKPPPQAFWPKCPSGNILNLVNRL